MIDELLAKATYQFAKTMPGIPHDYTLKQNWNPDEFEQVVAYIRKHGQPAKFYSKTYIYYYANGYKYWTMGSPIEETILINREKQ